MESELFGYEPGAFTGAIRRHIGKFEQAHEGTLFLDEIGDISPSLQIKLLRVLEEGMIYRLGGQKPIKVDVRIITATNCDLAEEVIKKRFRRDLYHRVQVLNIHVPPLRDRKEDIPILAQYFVKRAASRFGKKVVLSNEALQKLLVYSWPGNVRELENTITRAVVLARGSLIHPEDIQIPDKTLAASDNFDLVSQTLINKLMEENKNGNLYKRTISLVEYQLLLKAMELTNGNQLQAARLLGINRNTLRAKLRKYRFQEFN